MTAARLSAFDKSPGRRRSVSLTPLVDVVFLLLIFFMLASTFLDNNAMTMLTPESDAEAVEQDDNVVEVRLIAGDRLNVDGEESRIERLAEMLKTRFRNNPALSVTVLVEETVPTQSLVSVLEAVKESGISSIVTAPVNSATGGEISP
ncbi:MAG: biopolymer transporter ExbD [Parvularculales bacterium]